MRDREAQNEIDDPFDFRTTAQTHHQKLTHLEAKQGQTCRLILSFHVIELAQLQDSATLRETLW